MLHVVHLKSGKVAGHNPSGLLRQRQSFGITTGLLIRRQFRAIALFGLDREVNMRAFLLNQDSGGNDIGIDEIGAFFLGDGLHGQLKLHPCHRVVDAEDVMQ